MSDPTKHPDANAQAAIPKKAGGGRDTATSRIDPADIVPQRRSAVEGRYLLLIWSGETAHPWPLPDEGESIVGRAVSADICVEYAVVSRRHARISVSKSGVQVIDLNSQNGTRVNGERLSDGRLLVPGDILSFGDVTAVLATRRSTEKTISPDAAPQEQVLKLGERNVVVADPVMTHVYTQLTRLAPTELSVLILGETGTGKEVAAAALHEWSSRRAGPLISINCAALPDSLVESELFGFERGAFSGAVASKRGLLEAADGGTVLFDEIGDLPLPVQAKLLRVIETRRLTRLGSVREMGIDVRIIAATNRELEDGVKAGWFRADLYYRLSAAIVRIPPLRLRPREIPLLANKFIQETCLSLGRSSALLDAEAIARLVAHPWPGNVRELKNLIEYVVSTTVAPVITADLVKDRLNQEARQNPLPVAPPATSAPAELQEHTMPVRPLAQANRDFERRTIESVLAETGGNKTHAAKRLGVPLRTFMDKIKRYGL